MWHYSVIASLSRTQTNKGIDNEIYGCQLLLLLVEAPFHAAPNIVAQGIQMPTWLQHVVFPSKRDYWRAN
jgi:hypothetical protein